MSEANSGGGAASLSLSHNSDNRSEATQTELPFKLTGSQAKTAHALQCNIERMIREAGLERVGFLTLTVGDQTRAGFKQVWDAAEASRRINNLNRRVLPTLFSRAVVVTERHKSGAIHFHIVGAMGNGEDIRTGFDFEAFLSAREHRQNGAGYEPHEKRYADSAPPALRAAWAMLRETLPGYGFGRAELTPIRKTGESIAGYVAKYVKKNLEKRREEDRGKKLVRYIGWNREQMKPNEFAWATPRAAAWRTKAATLAALVGATRETIAKAMGARWAWRFTEEMNLFNDTKGEGEQLRPMDLQTWPLRSLAIFRMRELCSSEWLRRFDAARMRSPVQWRGPSPKRPREFTAELLAA